MNRLKLYWTVWNFFEPFCFPFFKKNEFFTQFSSIKERDSKHVGFLPWLYAWLTLELYPQIKQWMVEKIVIKLLAKTSQPQGNYSTALTSKNLFCLRYHKLSDSGCMSNLIIYSFIASAQASKTQTSFPSVIAFSFSFMLREQNIVVLMKWNETKFYCYDEKFEVIKHFSINKQFKILLCLHD